jgi:hypothetical protein
MTGNLKDLCNLIMNMDSRVRFVGVLDENARLVEGGMKKNISSLLPSNKDDIFYLRIVSQLKELKDFTNRLGDISYIFIKMEKISFVTFGLKDNMTLLVSMEPDADPSFIIPSIKNSIVE